jgi:hypothetical protein
MHKESSKLRKITSIIETRGWPVAIIRIIYPPKRNEKNVWETKNLKRNGRETKCLKRNGDQKPLSRPAESRKSEYTEYYTLLDLPSPFFAVFFTGEGTTGIIGYIGCDSKEQKEVKVEQLP